MYVLVNPYVLVLVRAYVLVKVRAYKIATWCESKIIFSALQLLKYMHKTDTSSLLVVHARSYRRRKLFEHFRVLVRKPPAAET